MPRANDSTIVGMLERARAGDQQELGRLLEACRSYLGILARAQVEGKLRAKVDPSDIVQETFLEAHRDFPRFQGTTAAEWLVWLRRILAHNSADVLRQYRGTLKRRAAREVPLVQPGDDSQSFQMLDPSAPGESPSQAMVRRERELEVADAVARLEPDYQEVIILRNLQRLPFNEVADRMGRSRPAVQMLWMRAIQKLREGLVSDE